MEILLVKFVTAALLPPGVILLVGIVGLALLNRVRRIGFTLVGAALVSLFLLSTPYVAVRLIAPLEAPPLTLDPTRLASHAQAIVLLAGGRNPYAPEYGGDTVSSASLVRLRYTARLQRASGLPLLVSGGQVYGRGTPEATLIAKVLTNEMQVPVRWIETASRNTAENARYSRKLLARAGIRRIVLVTSAAHIPRARAAFERAGIQVLSAPTDYQSGTDHSLFDWRPTAGALGLSTAALHEWLGRAWYRLRY